ncbi:hypothetical protein EDB19DRAFT_1643448, partial [Suillus lakei]
CETCQSAEATFNCMTCTGDHGWCRSCLIQSHQSLPFHKIQFWNDMCFQDVTLADLGFIWYLGHGGEPCPLNGAYGHQHEGDQHKRVDGVTETDPLPHDTTAVTIVHSSGVFTHNVSWCHCLGSHTQHLQLLRARLFPSSSTQPKTIFTFEVLDHFLIDAVGNNSAVGGYNVRSNAMPAASLARQERSTLKGSATDISLIVSV